MQITQCIPDLWLLQLQVSNKKYETDCKVLKLFSKNAFLLICWQAVLKNLHTDRKNLSMECENNTNSVTEDCKWRSKQHSYLIDAAQVSNLLLYLRICIFCFESKHFL